MGPKVLAVSAALLLFASMSFATQPDEVRVFGPPAPGHVRPPLHMKPFVTPSATGYFPSTVRTAYGFSAISNKGAGQTIAIVDAFDDPTAANDLSVFSSKMGLPPCTTSNGCFTKVYASGSKPATNASWALEIALDIEWAHAIAPQAKILLVEASSDLLGALGHAVDVAVRRGASQVSMSWGGNEFSGESNFDTHFSANNVTFLAATGDSGHGSEYPSSSKFVIAVGGTTLHVTSSHTWSSETAWNGSSGGHSSQIGEPSYQSSYPIPNANGKRGTPDVAYDANPNTGFPVYDTTKLSGQAGWFQVGGTSAGTPQWAALVAIVNSIRRAKGKATLPNPANQYIYPVAKASVATRFHDITTGTNGACGSLCTARTGFDYVTGIGSPKANTLIPALAAK